MRKEIKLGDQVKDKITGFKGIAVAKTEFINGCVQWEVVPKIAKDNKYPESVGIDQQTLEVIVKKRKKIVKKNTGGATTKPITMRGY